MYILSTLQDNLKFVKNKKIKIQGREKREEGKRMLT